MFPQIEDELRRAVLGRRYTDLPRLAELFRESVEVYARSLAPDDPLLPEIAARAQEFLHGALAQVRADREMLAAQLAQLPKVQRYLDEAAERITTIRFDG